MRIQRNSFAFSNSIFQTEADYKKENGSANDSKCRFMSDACLASNNKSSVVVVVAKIDSIMCACAPSTTAGELSFWTPAAFQLFAKTLLNEWRRNCRCTAFSVYASRQRLNEHYGFRVQLNLYLRNELITQNNFGKFE